ncbi:MAG TPA: hypothetical protein VGO61_10425 [Steroidobacteraceae bacterium]|jgi:hypothetical protein|nr:hypothetical protein [Steroidobacteraceae bacterium]
MALLAVMVASSATASRCDAADAAAVDPRVLAALSIDADSIKFRARCEWWFAGDGRRANSCLYAQTADSICFLPQRNGE